jgi:3'-5' exoribonuclease
VGFSAECAVSRPKPILARLSELTSGQFADFFALLAEKAKGLTREGKPYYTCRFRDLKRTVTFMVWADGPWFEECEKEWREGGLYKLRATYGESERYGPQLELQNLRAATKEDQAEGLNPGDFVEHSRFDPAVMIQDLLKLVESEIADEPLRRLILTILQRHAEPLQRLPATLNKFYPFAGGLLEHTLSVARSCLRLADQYVSHYDTLKPPLNRDLVVAGAVLHDIGRVVEFSQELLVAQPSVPGRLFGHLFLGRDLVRDTARELGDVDPERLQLLEHILITHLNLPEWGSPRLPLVPECLIVHHADDLDAKLEMYARCLSRDQAEGPFTERDPILGRQLFKGRSV